MPHWALWIIVALACGVAEIFTLTFFMAWFGIGALAAATIALLKVGFPGQFLMFLLVSLILVLSTKRLTAKWTRRDEEIKTNVYGLVGREGYVIQEIPEGGSGQVKIQGEVWTATSSDGKKVPLGAKIVVARVEGVHLVVKAGDL